MADEPKADYDCTQDALYSISETIYASTLTYLAQLVAYKSKYTLAFVNGLKAKIPAARALPDAETRDAAATGLREELTELRGKCTDNFIALKGYIDDGFAKNLHKSKYIEAGQTKMNKAIKDDWEQCQGLNTDMGAFIALYPTELTAGFMPVGFGAQVTADSGAFDAKYLEFKNARQTGVGTGNKIMANNEIFADVMGVCADAGRCSTMRNDAEIMKLFTWSIVKELISPPGSASLKVGITQSGTNLPVGSKNVKIQTAVGVAMDGVTNDEGVVVFERIDAGDYVVTIDMSPAAPIVKNKVVNTGVDARLEVVV